MSTWRSHDEEGSKADAEIAAGALSVFHETGLTPQQLREQRDELLAALKVARTCLAKTTQDSLYDNAKREITAAIASVEAAA